MLINPDQGELMPTYLVSDNRGHYKEFNNRVLAHDYASTLMYLDEFESREVWNSLMLGNDCHVGHETTTVTIIVQGDK
jgi:hypothetical protein